MQKITTLKLESEVTMQNKAQLWSWRDEVAMQKRNLRTGKTILITKQKSQLWSWRAK
jgi:hypothetical protein